MARCRRQRHLPGDEIAFALEHERKRALACGPAGAGQFDADHLEETCLRHAAMESRRTVMCFDRRDGKLLWQAGPTWTQKELTYPDNPPCTPSPVCDGKLVIAWFGSAGVHCYDFDGRELWHRDLGNQSHMWGACGALAQRRGGDLWLFLDGFSLVPIPPKQHLL